MFTCGIIETINRFHKLDIEFSGALLLDMCTVVQATWCATVVARLSDPQQCQNTLTTCSHNIECAVSDFVVHCLAQAGHRR